MYEFALLFRKIEGHVIGFLISWRLLYLKFMSRNCECLSEVIYKLSSYFETLILQVHIFYKVYTIALIFWKVKDLVFSFVISWSLLHLKVVSVVYIQMKGCPLLKNLEMSALQIHIVWSSYPIYLIFVIYVSFVVLIVL